MKDKEQPVERPAQKPPIYPVAVIEAACRALEVLAQARSAGLVTVGSAAADIGNGAGVSALRIIADGLASHERAIKGEP